MEQEGKEDRYSTVNKLLKASNYISDSDLEQLKEITERCYKRYENRKGAWWNDRN